MDFADIAALFLAITLTALVVWGAAFLLLHVYDLRKLWGWWKMTYYPTDQRTTLQGMRSVTITSTGDVGPGQEAWPVPLPGSGGLALGIGNLGSVLGSTYNNGEALRNMYAPMGSAAPDDEDAADVTFSRTESPSPTATPTPSGEPELEPEEVERALVEQQGRMLGALGNATTNPGIAMPDRTPAPKKLDKSEALARALDLLRATIGDEATARIQAGGGYPIQSKLWPDVVYVVPASGTVKILRAGQVIGRSCIVSTKEDLPWPDVVLTRIRAIQNDETIVYTTGNLS